MRQLRTAIVAFILAVTLVTSGCSPRMFGYFAQAAIATALVAAVLHHHDSHYHHHHCGHEYVVYEEREVYHYQDRWEYYDPHTDTWYYYEEEPY